MKGNNNTLAEDQLAGKSNPGISETLEIMLVGGSMLGENTCPAGVASDLDEPIKGSSGYTT